MADACTVGVAQPSPAQPRHGRRSSLDGMMREGGANTQAYGGGPSLSLSPLLTDSQWGHPGPHLNTVRREPKMKS